MIVDKLKKMVTQFPTSLRNQLEMQKYIQSTEEDKRALRQVAHEKTELIKQKEEEIRNLSKHLQNTFKSEKNKKERMKLAHSMEMKELQLHTEHLEANLRAKKSENEAIYTEVTILEKKLTEELERLDERNQKALAEFQVSLTKERERAKQLLLEEKERGEKERQKLQESLKNEVSQLMNDNTKLQAVATQAMAENEALRSTNMRLEELAAMKEARVKRHIEEIKIKEELLQKKDDTNATLTERLMKARKYLATKKQV